MLDWLPERDPQVQVLNFLDSNGLLPPRCLYWIGNKILYYIDSIFTFAYNLFLFLLLEISRNVWLNSYRHPQLLCMNKIWILMITWAQEVVWWTTLMCNVLSSDKLLMSTCPHGLNFTGEVQNLETKYFHLISFY